MNTLSRLLMVAVAIAVSIVAASCTSSGTAPSSTSTPSSTAAAASSESSAKTTIADAPVADNTVDSAVRELLDIPGIKVVSLESGGGSRPELEWEQVDGAFFYNVVLLDPTGRGYWGWEGTNTSVHVGGEPVITEGLSGPSVIDGMSWQVAAYDADLNLIALSPEQPIAP